MEDGVLPLSILVRREANDAVVRVDTMEVILRHMNWNVKKVRPLVTEA